MKKPSKLVTSSKRPPNPRGHNQWTNADPVEPYTIRFIRAKSYLEQGKTLEETRRLTGLAVLTIRKIREGIISTDPRLVSEIKKAESSRLAVIGAKILDHAGNDETILKSSLLQATTAYSQLVDKRRLLDGQSTNNVAIHSTLDELSARGNDITEKLKDLTAHFGAIDS